MGVVSGCQIEIAGRKIGPGHPAYIIAEMSANHRQNFDEAVRIIRAAKEAGADAIKIQTYTPDTMTIDCDRECFRLGKGTIWEGKTLYQLYGEAHTPWEWQPRLMKIANDLGLHFFSTPFDETAVDFLRGMDVPAYKIASFEIVDTNLIRYVARAGKPLIISTGMSTQAEIEEALSVVRQAGGEHVALLKCTSAYPADASEMNLRTIPHMIELYNVPVGLSDHSLDGTVPVAAVALGACIVEKHFTLSRGLGGPDSAFSLEPQEFKNMVDAIRTAERALGEVKYAVTGRECASTVFRRSLFVVRDMKAGEVFTKEHVRSIRPGIGLHSRYFDEILGCRAACDIIRGTKLGWELVKKVD